MVLDCTLWPSRDSAGVFLVDLPSAANVGSRLLITAAGAMSLDESLTVMQAVCAGNSHSVGLILLPQRHSSCAFATVMNNRRLLEDKCIANLVCILALPSHKFASTLHQSSHRKTSPNNDNC